MSFYPLTSDFMYHYITLGSLKIYMTGLGILAFIVVFLLVVYIKTKKYRLSPQMFWKNIPFYLLFTYLLSTYLYYLIEIPHVFIPSSVEQLLLYLSPYEYNFHFIGIVIGIFLSGAHFLKIVESVDRKTRRLHVFFSAIVSSTILLGVFLLLGDNFIGLSTDSSLYVSAIKDDSNMAVYGKVLPLGLFLSLLSLLGLMLYLSRRKKSKNIAYGGFAIMSLFLAILLLFQQYPRHLVINIGDVIFDIKQYLLIFLTIFFFRKQYKKDSVILETGSLYEENMYEDIENVSESENILDEEEIKQEDEIIKEILEKEKKEE